MDSFNERRRSANRHLCNSCLGQAIVSLVVAASPVVGEPCLAPQPPFVPSDSRAVREYADIIRTDFEIYIRDIQSYFRCLEEERARAFEEAREVSEEYRRFLELFER